MYHTFKVIARWLYDNFEAEKDRWILWSPVALGTGIGFYFSLDKEPSSFWPSFLMCVTALFCRSLIKTESARLVLAGVGILSLGYFVATLKTWYLATPMLEEDTKILRLQAKVVKVEDFDGMTRLTLNGIHGFNQTIGRVRISLRGALRPNPLPSPGDRVKGIFILQPVPLPPFDGSFDFRRKAYFEGLSAIGFAIKPLDIQEIDVKELSYTNRIERIRNDLTQKLRQGVAGERGGILAALVTGDRSGISQETKDMFARAGLAHLLAISGLHLTLVAGLGFLVVRRGLSMLPILSLRWHTKKMAACLAFFFTFAYLLVCGIPIPALRAFMMTTIVLLGILFDRPAISLRNLAFAAMIILVIMPEALLNPSFQLSFAAVTGLISYYERSREWVSRHYRRRSILTRLSFYGGGVMLTTLIASTITLPFVAYTFKKITLQSLSANLIGIPLMSFIIMPLTVIYVFVPLDFIGSLLNLSIGCLINVAQSVAQWPGSEILVPQIQTWVFALMVFGLLWCCLMTQSWRWLGIGVSGVSILIYLIRPLPDLMIGPKGKLIGLRLEDGQLMVNSLVHERAARKAWMSALGQGSVLKWQNEENPLIIKGQSIAQRQQTLLINNQAEYGKGVLIWLTRKGTMHQQFSENHRPWGRRSFSGI
jgi:competence protein ComEC